VPARSLETTGKRIPTRKRVRTAQRKEGAIPPSSGLAGVDMSLQGVMDGMEDKVLVIDSEYRVRFADLAMRHRWQADADSLVGWCCLQVFPDGDTPCRSPLWECPLRELLRSRSRTTIVHSDPTGGADSTSDRHVEIGMWPLGAGHGSMDVVIELRRDVTVETQADKDKNCRPGSDSEENSGWRR
jgi:hypothetical protein